MVHRRTLAVAIAGLLAQGASGLYADEVGKLDWHRQNLGRFASAAFDGRGGITVVGEVRFWGRVERRGVCSFTSGAGMWIIGYSSCSHPHQRRTSVVALGA